jgi:cell division protein FtsQ
VIFPLAVFVLLVALVAGSLFVPQLEVKQVSVQGAQTISSTEIAGLAPVPEHRNILAYYILHSRALSRKIEKAEPAVQSAKITVQLPDTLVVTIAERQPYAVLNMGGNYWVLDIHGVPFRQVAIRPSGLPCVVMPPGALNPVLGQSIPLSDSTPMGAFYQAIVLLSSQRMAILSKIREITVDQNANLCLNMTNNLQIRLGQSDNLAQKLALAATALNEDTSLLERAQYLDFTDPQRPAWKPRSPVVPVAPLPRDNDD